MSTENKQDKTQSLELGSKLLGDDDYELLVRMLPYCCCARCKHWRSFGRPQWPGTVFFLDEGHVDCLSTLYSQVDWDGHCRRFPPKVVPPEELRELNVWGWPITSCRDCCGEFSSQGQPTR